MLERYDLTFVDILFSLLQSLYPSFEDSDNCKDLIIYVMHIEFFKVRVTTYSTSMRLFITLICLKSVKVSRAVTILQQKVSPSFRNTFAMHHLAWHPTCCRMELPHAVIPYSFTTAPFSL